MNKKFHIISICLALIIISYCINSLLNIDQYPNKIWLHRCNSIEKYEEKHARYPNVEIDVVFRDDNEFDVTHDQDITYNLPLDSFLQELDKEDHIWLDIKNLDSTNQDDIFEEMEKLRQQYNLSKNQFIIESPKWQLLSLFTQQGYYTSCYVTYKKPSELNKTELKSCISTLQEIADSGLVCALSFPNWWYSSIKKYLNSSIDLLTWEHRITQFEFFLMPKGWRMLHDSQLKVVLIKDKGNYHR